MTPATVVGSSGMSSARVARVALATALPIFAACAREPFEPPAVPPGCALLVEDVPILVADVDRWLDAIRLVEPTATLPHARRLALVNIELPRVVGSLLDPDRRERTRDAASALRERLVAPGAAPATDPALERVEGGWRELGLDVWALALDSPPGVWSEVVETAGAFVVFRTLEAPTARSATTALPLERAVLPYLDGRNAKELIESAFDQTTMTVVDPAWAEIVPEHYKYRMGAAGRAEAPE